MQVITIKEFIGRSCRIHIKGKNDKDLFFSAKKVNSATDDIICFTDIYNNNYCFSTKNIIEITDK